MLRYTVFIVSPDLDFTSPIGSEETESSLLAEDDHFGLLLKTLHKVVLSKDSFLTSDSFNDHVGQYEKTVVVFYMSCEWSFPLC